MPTTTSQTNEPAAIAPRGTPSPLPPKKVASRVAAPAITVKKRLTMTASIDQREAAGDGAGAVGRQRPAATEEDPAEDPLEGVVEVAGEFVDLAADVAEQADALGGDRGAHLGRLGDPLDQLLGLLRGEQAAPDLVDQLRVEGLDQRLLHRGAVERALHGLLDHRPFEHPGDRPLDRLRFDRGDDRLLGRDLDRFVDPGRAPDRPGAAGARAQQPRREWRALVGHRPESKPRRIGRRCGRGVEQAVEELALGGEQLAAGALEVEPLGAVDLGELGFAAAARRPLHLECVAVEGGRVEVPRRPPGVDDFPGPLADRAEVDQLVRVERPAPPRRAPRRARAAPPSRESSSPSMPPFGIDQAPSSRVAQ